MSNKKSVSYFANSMLIFNAVMYVLLSTAVMLGLRVIVGQIDFDNLSIFQQVYSGQGFYFQVLLLVIFFTFTSWIVSSLFISGKNVSKSVKGFASAFVYSGLGVAGVLFLAATATYTLIASLYIYQRLIWIGLIMTVPLIVSGLGYRYMFVKERIRLVTVLIFSFMVLTVAGLLSIGLKKERSGWENVYTSSQDRAGSNSSTNQTDTVEIEQIEVTGNNPGTPLPQSQEKVVPAQPVQVGATSCETLGGKLYITNDTKGSIGCDVKVNGAIDLSESYCTSIPSGRNAFLIPDEYGRENQYYATLTQVDMQDRVEVYVKSTSGERIKCEPNLIRP